MDVEKFTKENLLNKNGKLEGQRLSKKWFEGNNFPREFAFFEENNILGPKNLHIFIWGDSEVCECGKNKRFLGFGKGFQEYCEYCSRRKNNGMLGTVGDVDLELGEIINFVTDIRGNYSSSRIKKLSSGTLEKLRERTDYLPPGTKISERLYHLDKNLQELPKCKLCGKEHNNFRFSKNGYFDYCKGICSYRYNRDEKTQSIKIHQYPKIINKFQNIPGYTVQVFTLEDYLENNTTIKFKHNSCGFEYQYDIKYQGHFKCPKCFPIRSKKQYEIFEFIGNNCKMNDRQIIKPLEIDILGKDFGVEYDSLMFHSYGKSNLEMFNNEIVDTKYHLRKTELLEEQGLQLFHIFSNEWIRKPEIWKSVINSKLGRVRRIFGRKCQIQEISSQEARNFLESNHLQGSCGCSVRVGLFYQGELVSLMTFGKSRYAKGVEWELIRFASLLNTQVIGGASKLLKYFERNYSPESIISYANRRWSQGNLYEKLGFEFQGNTPPNYFYFRGDDSSELKSREQFQKHKLQERLETFDPDLTETENMFRNGYRKIYDSGNKKYIKKI